MKALEKFLMKIPGGVTVSQKPNTAFFRKLYRTYTTPFTIEIVDVVFKDFVQDSEYYVSAELKDSEGNGYTMLWHRANVDELTDVKQ